MKIIVVDDEPLVLQGEAHLIRRIRPDAEVSTFGSPLEALEYFKTGSADVVFLDIQMPRMTGVELAQRLKILHPELNVIFTTAYDHFYSSAMQIHASGYILKPMREEDAVRELDDLRYSVAPPKPADNGLFIRAFGDFEVFYDGKPLKFRYQKTKELFAYLVDRRGAMVESDTLMTVLWGGEDDRSNFFKQLRKDLKDTLEEVGCDGILDRRRGTLGITVSEVKCDYFDWLSGLPAGINAYRGEYMRQYGWAESTWMSLEGKSKIWED